MTKIEKTQITDHLDTDHFGVICMLLLNLDGMYFMIGSSLSGGFLKERSYLTCSGSLGEYSCRIELH